MPAVFAGDIYPPFCYRDNQVIMRMHMHIHFVFRKEILFVL